LIGGVGVHGLVLGSIGWEFQGTTLGGTWTSAIVTNQLPRAPIPDPVFGVRLAYNSSGYYVLMFGGCQYTGPGLCGPPGQQSATWEFVNGSWRMICSSCG